MRNTRGIVSATVLLCLLFVGGCGNPASPTPTTGSPYAEMLAQLDEVAGKFEDRRDVKCWTSFKRLETFVAGCQLAPATTHLKSEIVIDWVDQVWQAAAASSTGPRIDAADFDRVAHQHFRWNAEEYFHGTLHVGDRQFLIPLQDFDNYLGTVEPIRIVQTLARRLERQGVTRIPLDAPAIESAVRLAAILSTALLKESNRIASQNNHVPIVDEDVLTAGQQIADSAGLAKFDPSRVEEGSHEVPTGNHGRDAMLADIRAKIQSLDVFNTNYSRDVLGQEFSDDLSQQESQWAMRPVSAEASQAYKENILVGMAKELYTLCAQEHPGKDPLTGLDVLDTVLRHYPHATYFEGGVSIFPENHQVRALVEEIEADAFRDTAWHWRSLERAVLALRDEHSDLPVLDLYAMEELSEFLSVYAVALLREAGTAAETRGAELVSLADLHRAHGNYQRVRATYREAPLRRPEKSTASRFAAGEQALAELSSAYIEAYFSDVTELSGIQFAHETSDTLHFYRFSKNSDLAKLVEGKVGRDFFQERATRNQYPGEHPHILFGIAGGGVAVADIDGDGLQDIYLVSGKQDQLWKNLGGLRFREVAAASGLTLESEGRGAYFVDYDNDGDQDLFVTQVYAANRLFRNRGDGTFDDVTAAAGFPLREDLISHSAVWFDFDNDGHLDVFVGNFGDWLAGELPLEANNSRNGQPNLLYRNRGDGTFVDITEQTEAGDTGWAHAVSHFDANNDGWQDLYIANDFGRDVLLLNEGGQRFVDGTPDDLYGNFHHGMSVGFSDFNHDGVEDIYVSNIAMFSFITKHIKPDQMVRALASRRTTNNARMVENNLFLVSFGETFLDRHHEHFQRSQQGSGWAWDADFFDFDNDGADDLYILNGREKNLSYNMERNVLYKQFGGQFYDVSEGSGADFPSNARGAVHADFDNDGDLDVIVNNYESPAVLLRNNLQRNHWLRVVLQGTNSNRDGVGAVIRVKTAGGTQVKRMRGGSGFLSKEPCSVHFGLGDAEEVAEIAIDWPSGQRQVVESPAMDRELQVTEPE